METARAERTRYSFCMTEPSDPAQRTLRLTLRFAILTGYTIDARGGSVHVLITSCSARFALIVDSRIVGKHAGTTVVTCSPDNVICGISRCFIPLARRATDASGLASFGLVKSGRAICTDIWGRRCPPSSARLTLSATDINFHVAPKLSLIHI